MAADMSRVPHLTAYEAKAVVGLDEIYAMLFTDTNPHVCLIRHSDGQGGYRQTFVWKKADGSLGSMPISSVTTCLTIRQVMNVIDLAEGLQGEWPRHMITVNKLWP